MLDRVRMFFRRRHLYRQVFGTPEGRAVLDDLLRFCRVGEPAIVPGDPMTTGFNDGMRRVALRIAKLVHMTEAEVVRRVAQLEEEIESDD